MGTNTITPAMSMQLPIPGVTQALGVAPPGQSWMELQNAAAMVVDGHTHTPGSGVPVPTSGLNINSDLSFAGFNAIALRATKYQVQLATIGDPAAVYFAGQDLYANDALGNRVRLTASGAIAGTPGSISGLVAPAAAVFTPASGLFSWTASSGVAAGAVWGPLTIRDTAAGVTAGVTIQSPALLAASYPLILPGALPATTLPVTLSPSGALAPNPTIQISSLTTGSSTITGNETVGGTFGVTGAASMGSSLSVSGGATFNGMTVASSDFTFNAAAAQGIYKSGGTFIFGTTDPHALYFQTGGFGDVLSFDGTTGAANFYGIAVSNIATLAVTGAISAATLSASGGLTVTGGETVATGDLVFTQAAQQRAVKSGGVFQVGTTDTNQLLLITNSTARLSFDGATGAANFQGFPVTGVGSLTVNTSASVGGALNVTGFSTLGGGAAITGSNLSLSLAAAQGIYKTGGALQVGSSDANSVTFVTNTTPRIFLPSSGGVDFQAQALTNAASLAVTGAATIGTTLGVAGASTFTGAITVAGGAAVTNGNVGFTYSGTQSLLKSGGALQVGSSDANSVAVVTNSVSRILFPAAGGIDAQAQVLTNLGAPVGSTDAVTKGYLTSELTPTAWLPIGTVGGIQLNSSGWATQSNAGYRQDSTGRVFLAGQIKRTSGSLYLSILVGPAGLSPPNATIGGTLSFPVQVYDSFTTTWSTALLIVEYSGGLLNVTMNPGFSSDPITVYLDGISWATS